MARLQLFEFMDHKWFPRFLRDPMTAYLEAMYGLVDLAPFAAKLRDLMAETGATRIVDMGSGSTGPMIRIFRTLQPAGGGTLDLVLTDLYPSEIGKTRAAAQGDPHIRYESRSVDATRIPDDLEGVRTMVAVFHHLPPELARRVLENAARARAPIAIFEPTVRHPATVLTSPFILLAVFLMTLRIRPLSFAQIFFTYVIPLLPLLIWWDGVVSHLRTYDQNELRKLTEGIDAPGYRWEIGGIRVKGMPVPLPYLVGRPG